MKHNVGDKVKITANISDHDFEIGGEVEIVRVNKDDYGAMSNTMKFANPYLQFFTDEECEAIEQTKI